MAKAPKPGERVRKQERLDGIMQAHVRCDGKTYTLVFPLPTREQRALRQETGLTAESFLRAPNGRPAIGLDTLSVILWLARRQSGETALTLDAVDDLVDEIASGPADEIEGRLGLEWEIDADLDDETDPES